MNIDTSLLREKFIINEKNINTKAKPLSLCCPSTRMPISLQAGEIPAESFIIRAYNMHSCARMAAQIIQNYEKNGSIISRVKTSDWKDLWGKSLNSYEREYNPKGWLAIYNKGNLVFSHGKHHQLFDVIEKCDAINNRNYEESIKLAENYFTQAGKEINMIYDSNVALVAALSTNNARCSMVLRGPGKTTTFNYSLMTTGAKQKLNISQSLNAAADLLEGVQLSYMVGINNEKIRQAIIKRSSKDGRQTAKAMERIELLDKQISSMESIYSVHYRPERPNFKSIIHMSEQFTKNN